MNMSGWVQPDFVLVTGDAYVDHHSFGTAIIGRLLERYGYKVAVLPEPDFRSCEDFKRFGRPRLGFLINSGVVDSMVNNFSVFKNRRKVDEYAPGGEAGRRPDRAVIVYAQRAREAYKDVPVIIGGLEASLRRLGHYDYWSDRVRRSILLDSKADILIYGMGERAIVEIAEALDSGIEVKHITWIKGTCYKADREQVESFKLSLCSENTRCGRQSTIDTACDERNSDDRNSGIFQNQDESGEFSHECGVDCVFLPTFDQIIQSKKAYAHSFRLQYENMDAISARTLIEKYTDTVYVVQNPPQPPLEREELDDVYSLPFENEWHPSYTPMGGIPAFREIKFSVVSSRGCFGGCSFCALTYHQGKQVRSRSIEGIVSECRNLTAKPDFKGYIHDVGGPTANFRYPGCEKQLKKGVCSNKDCLYPGVCKAMKPNHAEYIRLLRAVRGIPKVKKVFIRSGIRYDYLMADPKCDSFIEELCKYHVSGTLKVAPEHISDNVLYYMRKPGKNVFLEFAKKYRETNERLGLKQYLIPYLISSHPGSTLDDAVELALFLKDYGFIPDQVQDFYPTPGTMATCMYYTELDPLTMKPVYVAKSLEEKRMQRALIHYNKPENRRTVIKALETAGRGDLIPVLLNHNPAHGLKSNHNSHKK